MAKPRVFIGSTIFDLYFARECVADFVKSLGYEPVRDEQGDVPYSPGTEPARACPKAAGGCDMFIFIVGGRFGSPAPQPPNHEPATRPDSWCRSVTMTEYEEAKRNNVPVYVFVEGRVMDSYEAYCAQRTKDAEAARRREWPAVGDPRVFDVLDEVAAPGTFNAVVRFNTLREIKRWLRQHWAERFQTLLDQTRAQLEKDGPRKEVAESAQTLRARAHHEVLVESVKTLALFVMERLFEQPAILNLATLVDTTPARVLQLMQRSRTAADFVKQLGGRDEIRKGVAYYTWVSSTPLMSTTKQRTLVSQARVEAAFDAARTTCLAWRAIPPTPELIPPLE